jgi:putative nucleotidyltransferase with HDIG domain
MDTYQQLGRLVYQHDSLTFLHIKRVAGLMEEFSRHVKLSVEECQIAKFGGLLHDIGKLEIKPEVLHKPSRLTEEEFAQIKLHPVLGYDILQHYDVDSRILEMARWHHERMDGKGYPDGLQGHEIPFLCRMMAIVDAWEAMTGKRAYRPSLSHEAALHELQKGKGTQFDPMFVEQFIDMLALMGKSKKEQKDDAGHHGHERQAL